MFINLILQAIKNGATEELKHLLDKVKEVHGEERYNKVIEAIRTSFSLLADVVDDTKTKVDDTLVALVLNALPK